MKNLVKDIEDMLTKLEQNRGRVKSIEVPIKNKAIDMATKNKLKRIEVVIQELKKLKDFCVNTEGE